MHTRRALLRAGSFALAAGVAKPALASIAPPEGVRHVAFHNLHTGENLKTEYWAEGRYIPDALAEVNHVLRDWRNNDVHVIDPKLLDLLNRLHRTLGSNEPFQVISGYRSPVTNAMLHERSAGVAAHSLHMKGMAIDIRLPDRNLADLHDTALSLRAGGVGYYPSLDFVHVDVGRVRRWGG